MCTNKRFIPGIHLRGRVERSILHGEGTGGRRRTGAEIQRALLAGIERVFRQRDTEIVGSRGSLEGEVSIL